MAATGNGVKPTSAINVVHDVMQLMALAFLSSWSSPNHRQQCFPIFTECRRQESSYGSLHNCYSLLALGLRLGLLARLGLRKRVLQLLELLVQVDNPFAFDVISRLSIVVVLLRWRQEVETLTLTVCHF